MQFRKQKASSDMELQKQLKLIMQKYEREKKLIEI